MNPSPEAAEHDNYRLSPVRRAAVHLNCVLFDDGSTQQAA